MLVISQERKNKLRKNNKNNISKCNNIRSNIFSRFVEKKCSIYIVLFIFFQLNWLSQANKKNASDVVVPFRFYCCTNELTTLFFCAQLIYYYHYDCYGCPFSSFSFRTAAKSIVWSKISFPCFLYDNKKYYFLTVSVSDAFPFIFHSHREVSHWQSGWICSKGK